MVGMGSFFSRLSGALSFAGGYCVGLSLGSSSIKLVELKRSGKSWKLMHFGMVQLPEDSIVNREIMNPIAVSESLKNLLNQIQLRSKNVCTALSGTSVVVKRMQLDVPNPRELQDQVFWEAEQYLPFDVAEVVMDYHILSGGGKAGPTDLVLVAAKTAVLDAYSQIINDSGLSAKWVDTDYFALQNVFEANYPSQMNQAVALVEIGASSLKLVVAQRGVPLITKDSSLGGRNVTADIQRHLSLSFTDAETLKTSSLQGTVPQELNDILHVAEENFASEIKRSLDFYHASSSGTPVSLILLTGGSSKIPGLTRIVEESCGVPCQLLNPFQSISYDTSVFTDDYIQSIGPLAAVSVGLAIRAGEK